MNAHSHTDFEKHIPQQGAPGLTHGGYEIELLEPLGNISAGDALLFDVEKEPAAGDIVALRRAGRRSVEIGTLLTDLPKGRWELLRTFGNVDKDEDGSFMFRAMADDIVRFPKMSEFVAIDACVDARVWPKRDTPAPKATKPPPARDAKGRFLPRGHAEPDAEFKEADKPETADGLPPEPETVPYERWSEAWQRADRYNIVTFKIEMLWRLLSPKIEDELGRSTGPLNGMLKGGSEGLYVLAKEDVEVLDYHLLKLGELIDDLVAVDAK